MCLCRVLKWNQNSKECAKNKNTLKDIRESIQKSPKLHEQLSDSMSSPISQVCGRFQAIKLKGEPIKCGFPASDDELTDFFENIRFIEPSLEHSQTLNTAVIAKSKSLTDFIKSHCHASHYAFRQIKKCTSEECLYCSEHPIAVPKDDFEKLSFVPLPLLNEKK